MHAWDTSSPAVVDHVVYVGATDLNFYALRDSDGTTIWRYNTGGPNVGNVENAFTPIVRHGTVYVQDQGTDTSQSATDSAIIALTTGGKLRWRVRLDARIVGLDGQSLYTLTPSAGSQQIEVLDASNGQLLWKQTYAPEQVDSQGHNHGLIRLAVVVP